MKKILIYGASVTAQAGATGYFDFVKAALYDSGFDVSKVAYGGCHIDDAGFYRFESALNDNISYVVFEWNTTGLSIYNEFKLAYLLQSVKNIGAKPIFLILPQEATIINQRNAESQVTYLCERYDIPILDLRAGLSLEKFKLMVRDVVHTNETGAKFYSEKIIDFINHSINNKDTYWAEFDKFENKSSEYLKSNLQSSEILLKKGDVLKIYVEKFNDVYAELLIRHRIGPFSPVVSISDGVLKKELSLWDPYCHYEREHFTLLMNNVDFKSAFLRSPFVIEISFSHASPRYELCRRDDVDFNVEKLIKINEFYSIGVDYRIEVLRNEA
jgi:hypothetical protein